MRYNELGVDAANGIQVSREELHQSILDLRPLSETNVARAGRAECPDLCRQATPLASCVTGRNGEHGVERVLSCLLDDMW